MRWTWLVCSLVVLLSLGTLATAGDANRLTYLDEFCDPYYVGLETAKLITPQWIGQDGVDAVIVLAIDDMSKPEHHEKHLRPILKRKKKIDGRAPVSLMTDRMKSSRNRRYGHDQTTLSSPTSRQRMHAHIAILPGCL